LANTRGGEGRCSGGWPHFVRRSSVGCQCLRAAVQHPSRSWDLGVAVGRLRRDAADRLDAPDFEAWVARECRCDARAAAAMKSWLVKVGEVPPGAWP
jgi:hypothetical protein